MDAAREWVPHQYVDEVTPPPRATPSDWIVKLPGDAYALASGDDSAPWTPRILHDGDIVEFEWSRDFGTASVMIFDDGRWAVDREPPDDVTHVCQPGDPETLAYGTGRAALEKFVRQWLDNDGGPIEQDVDVQYYTWSEGPLPFEFRAGAFHPVAT